MSEVGHTGLTKALGVDDRARRKGQTYGTILVDLEERQVVDLLEDRTAASLARWLVEHEGVVGVRGNLPGRREVYSAELDLPHLSGTQIMPG